MGLIKAALHEDAPVQPPRSAVQPQELTGAPRTSGGGGALMNSVVTAAAEGHRLPLDNGSEAATKHHV